MPTKKTTTFGFLPCPFCGGAASMRGLGYAGPADCYPVRVACDECEASGPEYVVDQAEGEGLSEAEAARRASAAWNRNASPFPVQPLTIHPDTANPATLLDRLRGIYRLPITDGLGAVGGSEEPDNPREYVRRFQTAPIQHAAADEIERLRAERNTMLAALREGLEHLGNCEAELDRLHGLGNDAGQGASIVWCNMRAAIQGSEP